MPIDEASNRTKILVPQPGIKTNQDEFGHSFQTENTKMNYPNLRTSFNPCPVPSPTAAFSGQKHLPMGFPDYGFSVVDPSTQNLSKPDQHGYFPCLSTIETSQALINRSNSAFIHPNHPGHFISPSVQAFISNQNPAEAFWGFIASS